MPERVMVDCWQYPDTLLSGIDRQLQNETHRTGTSFPCLGHIDDKKSLDLHCLQRNRLYPRLMVHSSHPG